MPKRIDIQSVLLIGAGPIVIGQACEFDYSGAQACKALKEEGIRVILVNSNPATIMTDPDLADSTYIEPITPEIVSKIIEKERPDAILPTMGGQTALNCALALEEMGVLKRYDVAMIGASKAAIEKAENRDYFRKAMQELGLDMPLSRVAHTIEEAKEILTEVGLPAIIRPSFTMGGSGGGIAYNKQDFDAICARGFDLSPTNELLIEESIIGWKEFEMEVVRDHKDNCIIICSIENFDPMGIHTGDSITVAPAQTLTDKEYQIMRNASLAVLRKIGVDTGGSNVQFALNPANGRLTIIEMNPRVSRSSALASKATGFPIAKVATKLAIGYTLDEITNDITGGKTPASFEPTIDYVVTKIPRFAFEKFPQADATLTTQMKSVGEVMAIGATFKQSLQKAIRGLEIGKSGFDEMLNIHDEQTKNTLKPHLITAKDERIFYIADAFRAGFSVDEVHNLSNIDVWFLHQIADIIQTETLIRAQTLSELKSEVMRYYKQLGFSDARLATLLSCTEHAVREKRKLLGVFPSFKRVDSCAAEFDTSTAYMYSTYEEECEMQPTENNKIMILGGGPNRIGQGIEFDYCCVHAAFALKEAGYETIMVNCNPETVSTDYDTSDRLYFEPLTLEDTLAIIDKEQPSGIIVHYGGQTPLKLANDLALNGANIIGTSPDAIDLAEDRERFSLMLKKLGLKQPDNGTALSNEQAFSISDAIGFPLVVRPSYVLGGRAMEIVYNTEQLENYMQNAVKVSNDAPVLLDSFLDHAIEVDIDLISDGEDIVIGGIMEHIEQAGIHSGDSACSLPPYTLSEEVLDEMRTQVIAMAKELGVVGLMNTQLAYQDGEIYVIEVNPRASRTVPFVSKAIGVPLANIAAKVMAGASLKSLGFTEEVIPKHYNVKEAVFPFNKFLGVDPLLGPEMRSTGEVMGIGKTFAASFDKAMLGAGEVLPSKGLAFISLRKIDRDQLVSLATQLIYAGFSLIATRSNQHMLTEHNIDCEIVNKVSEGSPHIVDKIKNDEIALIINSTEDSTGKEDSALIRCEALIRKVPFTTTVSAAFAMVDALTSSHSLEVHSIQEIHQ